MKINATTILQDHMNLLVVLRTDYRVYLAIMQESRCWNSSCCCHSSSISHVDVAFFNAMPLFNPIPWWNLTPTDNRNARRFGQVMDCQISILN